MSNLAVVYACYIAVAGASQQLMAWKGPAPVMFCTPPLSPPLSVVLSCLRSCSARQLYRLRAPCAVGGMKTRNSDLFWTRVRCIPGFGAENRSPLFRIFSCFWTFEGSRAISRPRQTPVPTKLRLKRFPRNATIFIPCPTVFSAIFLILKTLSTRLKEINVILFN